MWCGARHSCTSAFLKFITVISVQFWLFFANPQRHPNLPDEKLVGHFKGFIRRRAKQIAGKRSREIAYGLLPDLEHLLVGSSGLEQRVNASEMVARFSPFIQTVIDRCDLGYTWRQVAAEMELDRSVGERLGPDIANEGTPGPRARLSALNVSFPQSSISSASEGRTITGVENLNSTLLSAAVTVTATFRPPKRMAFTGRRSCTLLSSNCP